MLAISSEKQGVDVPGDNGFQEVARLPSDHDFGWVALEVFACPIFKTLFPMEERCYDIDTGDFIVYFRICEGGKDMEKISMDTVIDKDGEISIKGLPFKKGDHVMMSISRKQETLERIPLTGKRLLESGLVGIWADRTDIGNSVEFARQLRERAQKRWS